MVTKEQIAGLVIAQPNRVLSVAESAVAEGQFPALPQQTDPIIVKIDLDAPENRVFTAELELIEQHLGDLLQEMLLIDETRE